MVLLSIQSYCLPITSGREPNHNVLLMTATRVRRVSPAVNAGPLAGCTPSVERLRTNHAVDVFRVAVSGQSSRSTIAEICDLLEAPGIVLPIEQVRAGDDVIPPSAMTLLVKIRQAIGLRIRQRLTAPHDNGKNSGVAPA